ncbi:MAG: fumarylacetoacetate hydrolase family protein [Acidimicrobiia bacterium]|nr:fumarylacetoacetate hydrolase family protein [Acidimicrobiia bacterium]
MSKWVSFSTGEGSRVGLVDGDDVLALAGDEDILGVLGDLESAEGRVGSERFSLADVQILPTVPHPPSVRDFMAFEQHVRTGFEYMGFDVPQQFYELPVFYFTNPRALVGARDSVPVPPGSELFDFELEVAAVIGKEGSDLAPTEAEEHIAGYSIFVDWSARDVQANEMTMRLGPAKSKDTASTLGPFLVTPDELEPHRSGKGFDLGMRVYVNGSLYGSDVWANIHWSFGEMLSYASRGTTLSVGDVVGSGTCGMGCLIEIRYRKTEDDYPFLVPGDVVRVEIDGLGATENTIVEGVPYVDHRLPA